MSATVDLHSLRDALNEARANHGRRSTEVLEAFETYFRAASASGQPLDALRRYTENEQERFFAYTIPGPDGHVFWDGPKDFRRNDGRYRKPRRWWWAHVHGPITTYEDIVPTCGELNCINPEHCEKGRDLLRRQFTRDQMIGALKVAHLRLGRPPVSTEWDTLGLRPTRFIFRLRFGSWKAALHAAGMESVRPVAGVWTPEKCIEALRFVKKRLGHWPSVTEFRAAKDWLHEAELPASTTTIKVRLQGTWDEALTKAGRGK